MRERGERKGMAFGADLCGWLEATESGSQDLIQEVLLSVI